MTKQTIRIPPPNSLEYLLDFMGDNFRELIRHYSSGDWTATGVPREMRGKPRKMKKKEGKYRQKEGN